MGLPVVDISSGTELGIVKECTFDTDETRLVGLIIGERGPSKGQMAMKFTDVKSLGLDLVTVDGHDSIHPVDECQFLEDGVPVDQVTIVGKRVMTDAGRELGIIKDVAVDAETGSIVGYEVSESIIQDILSGRNLISSDNLLTIGEEAVIVSSPNELP